MHLFSDIDNNRQMILGAYKKLKSFYYYDKTQIHNRTKIAEWERNDNQMKQSIDDLAISLQFLDKGEFDDNIIHFLKVIDHKILPKKFKDNTTDHDTISNQHKRKSLASVNFFIDAPIEILILDMIWSLFITKIAHDTNSISDSVYANRVKDKSIFKCGKDLFYDIDFKSNRFFKPYFTQYSKWKNNAFDKLKKQYYNKQGSLLITLDIKSYYYNVDFDFNDLGSLLKNDPRVDSFANLTKLLELLYKNYSTNLLKFRNSTKSNTRTILPIGLISSMIIANIYLNKLDKKIEELQPEYYGRYVDDIMIVFNTEKLDISRIVNKNNAITDTLVDSHILRPDKDDYIIVDFKNLSLENTKIKCFYLNHLESSNLIDVIYEYGCTTVSEYNLQPELPFIGNDANNYFNSQAYKLQDINGTFKLREFRMDPNVFSAIKCITHLTIASKNIQNENQSDFYLFIKKQLKQILQFFAGTNAIEFKPAWVNVFILSIINKEFEFAIDFYKLIYEEITCLYSDNISDVQTEHVRYIIDNVKQCLHEHLKICFATSLACFPENRDLRNMSAAIDWNVISRYSNSIKTANMFNHNVASLPLQNYYQDSILKDIDDFNKDLCKLKKNRNCGNCDRKCSLLDFLDKKKLELSPRFLHLHEIHLAFFIFKFCAGGNVFSGKLEELFRIFKKYNDINSGQKSYIEKVTKKELVKLQEINISNNRFLTDKNVSIALASIFIDEFRHVVPTLDSPLNGMSAHDKNDLIRMLFEAKKMGANIIVFPEYYLPFGWSDLLSKFVKEQNIMIITGMQYLTHNSNAYNYLGIFIPSINADKYRQCLPIFREKNDYAPLEQVLLSHKGFHFKNSPTPQLRTIIINDVTLSDILCFELTNINYRSLLKGKIDMLFIPELNKDTNYFSAVVEATSRDLHCFLIQSNTSKYGDSRITAPFDSQNKNIVQIKGGHNNVLLLGKIDMKELTDKRDTCYIELADKIKNEFESEQECKKDKQNHEKCKHKVKDLPARFNERLGDKN